LFALYDQVAEIEDFRAGRVVTLTVEAATAAEALRALLSEALFRFATDRFVATGAQVAVEEAGATRVRAVARLWGENAGSTPGSLKTEVKAVTYHRLAVEPVPAGGWRATVLFDV
jgi:SHS2 domain-containing protein